MHDLSSETGMSPTYSYRNTATAAAAMMIFRLTRTSPSMNMLSPATTPTYLSLILPTISTNPEKCKVSILK